jgi:catecholate siderophore receptor
LFCSPARIFAQQSGGAAVSATAQAPTALLRGRVFDSSRAPIADATVAAVHEGSAPAISARTDPNGDFSMSLSPGSYTVSVSAPAFMELSRRVAVAVDSEASEWVLQVIPLRTALTITESPGYLQTATTSATRTLTPLRDVPQSITVVTQELMKDQVMSSMADIVRYVPGVTAAQGEGNRDQMVIRGNNTTADFFLNGVRDDVQYYRDLYNLERVEALKGPNAMVFGRGGGGGVINRVTKEAGFTPLYEFTLQGGSFRDWRFATDFNQPLNDQVALRLNGMYENADSFRNHVGRERWGINPTVTFSPSAQTMFVVGYEHFSDDRVADRGIPSFQGRPSGMHIATFVGKPFSSPVNALVDLGSVTFEHQGSRWMIRNRSLFGSYDKFYQNYVPGAVNAAMTQVSVSAYNNLTTRLNLFNQTDVTYALTTGGIRHTILGGIEIGRQITDNLRNTGFFNNTATSINAPFENPLVSTPVTFRPNASDADNHVKTKVVSTYLQDQIELSRYVQFVVGLRLDHFDLRFHNNRNGEALRRIDNLVSPRAGIVVKPVVPLSIYWNYGVSYLPSSGDQFSSLTTVTRQVKPEKFNNYELGVKWDFNRYLSLTTAGYWLDRTNTRSTDPNNPTAIVQTGATRNLGYELGVNGNITRAWRISGGYAYQNSYISSATVSEFAGAKVAQVPHHTFSLWNNYQIIPRMGAGLGIVSRSDMFAAVDNTVVVPGYARADAAVFFSLTERTRFQVNVENLFGTEYYVNAHSNNNISPGSSRSFRAVLVARF